MIIYVDIDNTLCTSVGHKNDYKKIKLCKPYPDQIKMINDLHEAGHFIVLYTNRTSYCERETKRWLKKHKVKYDDLKFDKPGYDLLIDDKTIPPFKYLTAKYIEQYRDYIRGWNFGEGRNRSKK